MAPVSMGTLNGVDTIGKRLTHAMGIRGASQNGLADTIKRMGFSLTRQQIGRMMRDERGTKNPSSEALALLSGVLHIRREWLEHGRGAMDEHGGEALHAPVATVELDERYPNRAEAAAFARRDGISEEAIRIVQQEELDADEDPPRVWWLDLMRSEEQRLKRKGVRVIPVPAEPVQPPPRGPRKLPP